MKTTIRTRALFTALLALLIVALIAPAGVVSAQAVPPTLTHQGRLFGVDNVALSGPQTLTFRVYDTSDATGAELWTETVDVVAANGYYSAVLGQISAIPDAVFDGSTRYLGVTVGDAAVVDELTPRLEITSVAYAIRAGSAENATGALTPESVTLNGGGTVLGNDGTVTVGGATIAPDGQISLGAATVNTDGSIVVGNTTINPDGSISVGGNPVIAADGGLSADSLSISVGPGLAGDGSPADPLVTTDVTLTGLEAAGCVDDQVPQYAAATGWSCQTVAGVDTNTTYEAGSGLTLTGPANTFSVDFGVAQQRVSGACAAGEAIQAINADGTVACEVDTDTVYAAGAGVDITAGTISLIDAVDDDTTYSAGAGIDITGTTISLIDTVDDDTTYTAGAGVAITGTTISLVDAVDDDTTYGAGVGLTLDGSNNFNVNTAAIQQRVAGTCAAGSSIRTVNPDGSVVCETDSDTTYTAGAGVDISGTTISLLDPVDDDTLYGAGTGLTLDGSNDFNVADDYVMNTGDNMTGALGINTGVALGAPLVLRGQNNSAADTNTYLFIQDSDNDQISDGLSGCTTNWGLKAGQDGGMALHQSCVTDRFTIDYSGRVAAGTIDTSIPGVLGAFLPGFTTFRDVTYSNDRVIWGAYGDGPTNAIEAQLILLDDAQESEAFVIYGGSCEGGNCSDPTLTTARHKFDSVGNAWHRGHLVVNAGNDLAELTPAEPGDAPLTRGDVVVIGRRDGRAVARSSEPYDTRVYGIVSSFEQASMVIGSGGKDHVPVALGGRVMARVTDEGGEIRPGDLLTTSSTPGHLMRCEDRARCTGAIAGKALDAHDAGRGEVLVLVTLQ